MNKKNEFTELADWAKKADNQLSNLIIAANEFLVEAEKIPTLHEMLSTVEELLCETQINVQKIIKYEDK